MQQYYTTLHHTKWQRMVAVPVSRASSLLRTSKNSPDGAYNNGTFPKLPDRGPKYYSEYNALPQRYDIPGKTSPERFILGNEGEIFYSPDHYKTFYQLE
jgi:hypothetical protein